MNDKYIGSKAQKCFTSIVGNKKYFGIIKSLLDSFFVLYLLVLFFANFHLPLDCLLSLVVFLCFLVCSQPSFFQSSLFPDSVIVILITWTHEPNHFVSTFLKYTARMQWNGCLHVQTMSAIYQTMVKIPLKPTSVDIKVVDDNSVLDITINSEKFILP